VVHLYVSVPEILFFDYKLNLWGINCVFDREVWHFIYLDCLPYRNPQKFLDEKEGNQLF